MDAENNLSSQQPPRPSNQISPPVFFGSAILIFAVVVFGASAPETANEIFGSLQGWIIETFGWFYLLVVACFLIFAIGIAVSSYGRIRLGADDSVPEFSFISWFAMLFSAGMGIGLMFYGVAEPLLHYSHPPTGDGNTVEAVREAMKITFFHWGFHAWAIYAVIGLSLAYFSFRHGLPLTIRSSLYPLIGDRIYGPIGHMVDIFAVVGTMFGVATSLGLGVLQVNSGLNFLFDVPETSSVQIMLIAAITCMATFSVVMGLDGGIRRVSELNLILAIVLVLFVLIAGPTKFLFDATVQNIGAYLGDFVPRTFNLYAYAPNEWIGGWTLFYWAWWIAWSPFVGMFIARVSRGRTIREFLLGVLFVPVGFTFIWLTVLGNSAIALDIGTAAGALSEAASANVSTALFVFLEYLPFTQIMSVIATLLVVTFFVTSSDSGSLVIDIITSGGSENPPVWQRIFWAVTEGVVASVLLLAGGLAALQTAALTAALPFCVIMIFVCWGVLKGLRMEGSKRAQLMIPNAVLVQGTQIPWQARLRGILHFPQRERANKFMADTAAIAFSEVADELRKNGLDAKLTTSEDALGLSVSHAGEKDFLYGIRLRGFTVPRFAFAQFDTKQEKQAEQKYFRAEVQLEDNAEGYDVMGYTKEQLISDVLSQYEKHAHLLHFARASNIGQSDSEIESSAS